MLEALRRARWLLPRIIVELDEVVASRGCSVPWTYVQLQPHELPLTWKVRAEVRLAVLDGQIQIPMTKVVERQ